MKENRRECVETSGGHLRQDGQGNRRMRKRKKWSRQTEGRGRMRKKK